MFKGDQPLLGGSSQLGHVVNKHGDRNSPKDRVVGPLPNGLSMACKWWLLTTYKSWDDPPSSSPLAIWFSSSVGVETAQPIFTANSESL